MIKINDMVWNNVLLPIHPLILKEISIKLNNHIYKEMCNPITIQIIDNIGDQIKFNLK